ncbi:chemotaxis protein CheB [Pantanalinema rosaneae CENA516]|uniref:chemotaxis protein CheB n=1 Tax=Pantanalinema rosaneae TaxID=1620701 RepID=UPI003D7002B8
MPFKLITIGASLGGLAALRTILKHLPTNLPAAIAIVQHRHKESANTLAAHLQQFTPLPVYEVEDKQIISPGEVYLAPADYHLLVEPGYFSLSTDDPVSYARPSIDVLLESAADAYGEQAIGVLLTGANQDGVRGLFAIKVHGGLAIVQLPETAESPVLPMAAISTVAIDWILPLEQIAAHLVQLCQPG